MSQSRWKKNLDEFQHSFQADGFDHNLLKLLNNPFLPLSENHFKLPSAVKQPASKHLTANSLEGASSAQKTDRPDGHYIPIEDFKDLSDEIFQGKEKNRKFLSSGTTSTQEQTTLSSTQDPLGRSQSYFSEEGLQLYRYSSLASFFSMMEHVMPKTFWHSQGYSLIPSNKEWKDSSLAQMVSWIGEYAPLTYSNEGQLEKDLERRAPSENQPVWIFATAFHLINLFDRGFSRKLPAGSIVIETGGTKGKSREMDRDEFYQLIADKLQIQPSQIISEYGMCELSSQAYDYPLEGSTKRSFRFPSWVNCRVTTGLDHYLKDGSGSLLVEDPMRIDYPYPIKTQDIAKLQNHDKQKLQSFTLQGRVPGSVLKGCSLLAEQIIESSTADQSALMLKNIINEKPSAQTNQQNIKNVEENLGAFFQSEMFQKSLKSEFNSPALAKMALDSLLASIPANNKEWARALEKSHGQDLSGLNLLLVLPNNHSIVGIYPIIFAYLSGIHLSVRLPKKYSANNSPLLQFIEFTNQLQAGKNQIKTLPHSFKINKGRPSNYDAMIVYGSNQTIKNIKEGFDKPVKGYGSHLTVSLLSKQDQFEIKDLIDDVLNLAQLGCLSTRAIILDDWSKEKVSSLQNEITKHSRSILEKSLSITQLTSLDSYEYQLNKTKIPFLKRVHDWDILLPYYDLRKQGPTTLENYLAPVQGVLPILNLDQNYQSLAALNSGLNSDLSITATPTAKEKIFGETSKDSLKDLGNSNVSIWNGSHQGSPLFLF